MYYFVLSILLRKKIANSLFLYNLKMCILIVFLKLK
ncbi:hypothetical protein [Escherichia coli]